MKILIDVIVLHRNDGVLIPIKVIWEDGKKYNIDKVLDIKKELLTKLVVMD